jgi:hypothetical protein
MWREFEAARSNQILQFNKEYTFHLYPAGFAHGNLSSQVAAGKFHIAFEIDLHVLNPDLEQTLELPDPGTPTTVIPRYEARTESKRPIWEWKGASSKPQARQSTSSGLPRAPSIYIHFFSRDPQKA